MVAKRINARVKQQRGGKFIVGEGTYYNGGDVFAAWDNITIGKYCRISQHVTMITNYGSHMLLADDRKVRCGPIVIGDNIWIGWGASIRGGVTIGDFAVIGMGAVVTKSVEPFHMVGGNPAVSIKVRPDANKIIRLMIKRCGGVNENMNMVEILTTFKKQGYTFADASQDPRVGSNFYVAPKGIELQYTDEFKVN